VLRIGMLLENEFTHDHRVNREAELLSKNGYEVYILCLNFGGSKMRESKNGVKIIRFKMNPTLFNKLRPLIPNFPFYEWLWKVHVEKFLEDHKINILHIHDLPLMRLGIKLGKKYSIPVIGDFHENFAEAIRMYPWAKTIQGKLFINFTKWEYLQSYCVNNLHKMIVVADETIVHYSEKYNINPDKIFVVDNSIDIKQFNHEINTNLDQELKQKYLNKIVFGFIGEILPNRGLHHLFNVLPDFSENNVKVVIVGRGREKKKLKNLLIRKRIESMVDWYRWQPIENLKTFINNFDVGITRLERNKQNDYTTPNKVFQYMFMEKAVLTADSLPMRRIIEDTNSGMVFKSNDYRDLSIKLAQLIENEALRKRLGKNGKKAVLQKYNWDYSGKNLIKLYSTIAES
jgi:glycosyltransferase involved in cell wall biosynthesis